MQITELSEDTRLWQQIVAAQQSVTAQRSPGLHLSRITNDIALTVYPTEFDYLKRKDGEVFADNVRALFDVGNVLEEVMAQTMLTRAGWAKPEPKVCEGIACSPDGFNARTRTIDEMKVTWKSGRDFTSSAKWQLYLWQVMSYMYAYGATRARLHVLHICGDWRPPLPWPPRTYVVRPTRAEIVANWRMVRTHAKDRQWL